MPDDRLVRGYLCEGYVIVFTQVLHHEFLDGIVELLVSLDFESAPRNSALLLNYLGMERYQPYLMTLLQGVSPTPLPEFD